ncbi:ATP-dependent DNA helicase RecQ [Chroococcidiopsis sp. FACHB-1243]|uniref:RecQ family ATP-dependent DNA helicase n=1 Tax=Chroococcidiopsis sp. [FACHB-1243] TaxID=2692781 RepID=UPI00177CE8A8|nr:ATP-dependent DNA helicase RecQ [Chroococcidiopsis sp. [FACHB-1243]]MBD2305826.1 ATP-dependent DNA helicase RecQ [Chroococcidiopsis sp. [FACHB-1243]]
MNDSESGQHIRTKLQQIWGYSDFRLPQREIIRSILSGQDTLIIMPTGGGKSICFQLPALLQTGLTIVVSPLVALMENQVKELRDRHLPAALLHSELPKDSRFKTLQQLERQQIKLLYLSPETLLSKPIWERLSQPQLKIDSLILDEAHCLSQWGDTFRPAYRRLGTVRSALLQSKPIGAKIAIAAFTATADPTTQQTIQQVLQLQQPAIFRQNPYRSNLHLQVKIVWTPKGRKHQLEKFIQSQQGEAGLVYVRTRRDSESLAEWLMQRGYVTAAYHAGLSPAERRRIEASWLNGEMQFVICTSAFGMGINKPNVRWVIHFHSPLLLSEYVQEVGRAGRDGKPSIALTLISEPTGWLDPEDKQRQQFFENKMRSQYLSAQQLAKKLPVKGEVEAVARKFSDGAIALSLLHSANLLDWQDPFHYTIRQPIKLQPPKQFLTVQQMTQYLTTKQCRWQYLLKCFGFSQELPSSGCGHCDRCKKH